MVKSFPNLNVENQLAAEEAAFTSQGVTDLIVSNNADIQQLSVLADADVGASFRVSGASRANGATSLGVLNTAGGTATVTASELLSGYTYLGASGGAVALNVPDATSVRNAMGAANPGAGAASEGLRLPDLIVYNSTAADLTVTGGASWAFTGSAAVNAAVAVFKLVYNSTDGILAIRVV